MKIKSGFTLTENFANGRKKPTELKEKGTHWMKVF